MAPNPEGNAAPKRLDSMVARAGARPPGSGRGLGASGASGSGARVGAGEAPKKKKFMPKNSQRKTVVPTGAAGVAASATAAVGAAKPEDIKKHEELLNAAHADAFSGRGGRGGGRGRGRGASGATTFGGAAAEPGAAPRHEASVGGYWSSAPGGSEGKAGRGRGAGASSASGASALSDGVSQSLKIEDDLEDEEEEAPQTFADGLLAGGRPGPVTLPLRDASGACPSTVSEAEPTLGEVVSAATRQALSWLADEDNYDYRTVLMQLPPALPFYVERTDDLEGDGTGHDVEDRLGGDSQFVAGRLRDLPSGRLGKLLIFESGAVKLRLAGSGVLLDVSPGIPVVYRADVAMLSTHVAAFLSHISQRLTLTPDLVTLLNPDATREWGAAPAREQTPAESKDTVMASANEGGRSGANPAGASTAPGVRPDGSSGPDAVWASEQTTTGVTAAVEDSSDDEVRSPRDTAGMRRKTIIDDD